MRKNSLFFLCFILPSVVCAGTMGPVQSWSKVATLSLGPVYSHPGKTQLIYLEPDVEKGYVTGKNSDALISGELFLGEQLPISTLFLGQLGLAVAAASPVKIQGVILEDADPDFNNYHYKYNVQHESVAIKAKLLTYSEHYIVPYLSGSIGLAFNRSSQFTISPILIREVPAPPFAANTDLAFMYTLGAGFQKALTTHWQAGIGYEFADWGQSALGRASGQTINRGPQLTHLYTYELQFSLTYLAGA